MNTYNIKVTGLNMTAFNSLCACETQYNGGDIIDLMASPLSFFYSSTATGGIETITLSGYFSVDTQEFSPQSLYFKSDGKKMYVLGIVADRVLEYKLTTPWDITTASYNNSNFFVAFQETSPTGLFFKSDGSEMYLLGVESDKIYQYSLTNYWDVSSAIYNSKNYSVGPEQDKPRGLYIKSDGLVAYVIGTSGSKVSQYTLSTPWDITTASYSSLYYSVSTEELNPEGLTFKSDGTKLFIIGSKNKLFEYNLSTPWDVSTASYNNYFIVNQDPTIRDVYFKNDGKNLFFVGNTYNEVYNFNLKNAWEIYKAYNDNYTLTGYGGNFKIFYEDLKNLKYNLSYDYIFCESYVNFDFSKFDQTKSKIIKLIFNPDNGEDSQSYTSFLLDGEIIYPTLSSIKTKYYPSSSFYTYYNPNFLISYEDGNHVNLTINLTSIQCGIYESYKDKKILECLPYNNNSSNVMLFVSDDEDNNIFVGEIYTKLPFILSANMPEKDIQLLNTIRPVPFSETIEKIEPVYQKTPSKNNPVTPPSNIYVYSEYTGLNIVVNNSKFSFGDEFEIGSGLVILSGGAPYFAGSGVTIEVLRDLNN